GQGPMVDGVFQVSDVLVGGGTRFGDGFDANDVELRSWGTLRIEFENCSAAQLSYSSSLPGFGSAQRPVTRLTTLAGSPCRDLPTAQTGNPRWVERRTQPLPYQSELAVTEWEGNLYALGG